MTGSRRITVPLWPFTLACIVSGGVRGVSLVDRPADVIGLVTAQVLIPLQAWGWLFAGSAAGILAGMVLARWSRALVLPALVVSAATYFAYTGQVIAATAAFGAPYATVGGLLVALELHIVVILGYLGRLPVFTAPGGGVHRRRRG